MIYSRFFNTLLLGGVGLFFLVMNPLVLQGMMKLISKYFLTRTCYYYKIIWYV